MTELAMTKKKVEVHGPLTPRQVAEAWFSNLEQNKFQDAQALLDGNVVWENIRSTPGVSDLAPWLGSYQGLAAALKSVDVWSAHSRLLEFKLLRLLVDGSEAVGFVHERAQCLANNNEYDVYPAYSLSIEAGKIKHYQSIWDISPLIKAYRNI